jgi:plasmid stabilization system protein ParE
MNAVRSADLDEIFSYIARDDREAAARIAETPYMGEATRKSRFRRIPIVNYLIVYEVGQDEVVIHYVRHGARRRPWEGE